jgi:hypothetical protein
MKTAIDDTIAERNFLDPDLKMKKIDAKHHHQKMGYKISI